MKQIQPAENLGRKRFLRINNVVKRTQIPERTLRYWAASGQIPARRNGKKIWVFDPDQIPVIIARRRNHGPY
jgi:DNA-binding transcriptional MerR regulator